MCVLKQVVISTEEKIMPLPTFIHKDPGGKFLGSKEIANVSLQIYAYFPFLIEECQKTVKQNDLKEF